MGPAALDPSQVVGLIGLGLVGGILGGFVGGGGAFVMVPGVMSLGSDGLTAVGTNLLHRLGRMATSARRRAALRKVDLKLLVLLAVPSLVGVECGRLATTLLRARYGQAAADLYLGLIIIAVLAAVARMLALDLVRSRRRSLAPPPLVKGVMQRLRPLRVPPVIRFPASNVVVSLWLVLAIGFAGGWLGGTIALGGFLTVPAMIYLLGAPASVAIATDMSLVGIVGLYGALSYAARGHVELRATLLLYLGSILGFHLGMLGSRLMRAEPVRIATCVMLALVVVSRVLALPLSAASGGWLTLGPVPRAILNVASLGALFGGGTLIAVLVLGSVARAARGHVPVGALDGGEED